MKKNLCLLSVLATLVVCSCVSNPEGDEPEVGGDSKNVSFSARIRSSTRATDLQFENGDSISVFASSTGSIEESNYAQNVCYEYVDNVFDSKHNLWYPSATQDLSFYAVYPYGDYTTPEFTFAINTDQREHSAYTASDLMTASAVGNNSEVVDLIFTHRMAKVVINLSSDSMPVGEQTVVAKGVKNYALANLKTNTFYSVEGSVTDVIASTNGTNSFKLLLPPQTIVAGNEFIEITIGDKVFNWVVDRDLIFNSGVEYTYNLEIKQNVLFTAQINPWGTPEDIKSVIPEEYLNILKPYITIHEGTTPPNIEGTYHITPNVLVIDSVGSEPGYQFADDYIQFYGQTADNTINSRSTQLLGDLSTSEGVFISGSGNDFTVYFNRYTTYDNGSWLVAAAIISGTLIDGVIYNYTNAFVILEDYDTVDQYLDTGAYRVICDGDYASLLTTWPLDNTRTINKSTGISYYAK